LTTPHDPAPKKKRLTFGDLFSHILFSADTWRAAIGITLAVILAPHLLPFDRTGIGRYVMFIAVVVVAWALSKVPGRWIARQMRLLFPGR
jgi:hypothetical protein